MNVLDAAYRVVHDYPGGASSLGPRISKLAATLSQEVAAVGTAKFGLLTAVDVSVMTGDMRILEAFAAECGRMTVPLPAVLLEGGDNVLGRLGDVLREQAHLVREVSESVADGDINANEEARIVKEAGELVAMVSLLLKEVGARRKATYAAREKGGAQ